MNSKNYTYLALGDSYTIGEGVTIYESFPYQVVQLMRELGRDFYAAEIVAKTGWTTGELSDGIHRTRFLPSYDFVTLLIGVNNQFLGNDINDYKDEFEELLKHALLLAGNQPGHVIVLSIPDWGATPFAEERDRTAITKEITAFNNANRSISEKHKVKYIDVMPGTEKALDDESLLAPDQLHPSGKEYARWANMVSALIYSELT